MKKPLLFLVFIGMLTVFSLNPANSVSNQIAEKVYIAVENDGLIAVIDPSKYSMIRKINLSYTKNGQYLMFMPHNVQVSPDKKTIWATANLMEHGNHSDHQINQRTFDEVIVIDTKTDRIIKRIGLDANSHLAHVVLTPDNKTALVTGQNSQFIYQIDAKTFKIKGKVKLAKQEPHGLRVTPDGTKAYIAFLNGESLGVFDPKKNTATFKSVNGKAIQTAITADGQKVLISLFDTKQIGFYSTKNANLEYIKLPSTARGPVQIYPTPDSKFLYVADQGYYFNQPIGNLVYKIDLQTKEVIKAIKVGSGPHGIVVSDKMVYVTNLISGDLSIIDRKVDKEISRIPVGNGLNGVTVWKI